MTKTEPEDEYSEFEPCTCGEPWCDHCAYQREQAVKANPCPTCKGSGLNPSAKVRDE